MLNLKTPAFALVALTFSFVVAPAAFATPITYDFTVTIPAGNNGPQSGTVTQGSFTFDDSVAVPGTAVQTPNLLTALNFIWNGITYTAATANTFYLYFGWDNKLAGFDICNTAPNCVVYGGQEQWFALPGPGHFAYSTTDNNVNNDIWQGNVTFAQAVPEPGNLALFAGGLLLTLGGFEVLRRRQRG